MGTKCYVGIENKARLVKKIYAGVNGVARLAKRGYIGVVPDNVQRTNTITISEEPTKITDYEKYHPFEDFTLNAVDSYQADTPTPETPQAIHTVTGDVIYKEKGKNLFNKNATPSYVQSGVVKSFNANGELVLTYTGTASANKYQDYTIFRQTNLNGKVIRIKGIWEVSGSNKGRIILRKNGNSVSSSGSSGNTITYTITDDEPITISVSLYVNYSGTLAQGDTITFKEVTMTIDNADMTYEEYQEQSKLIPLGDIELAKIGTYTDRIFKAQIGTPSNPTFYDSLPAEIKATLTLGKWYLQRNNSKVIINENSNVAYVSAYNYYRILIPGHAQNRRIICNYLPTLASSQQENFITNGNSNGVAWIWDKQNLWESSLDNFKNWLETHNLIVWYSLDLTPTTTEITDQALITALEQVLQIRALKGETNISITGEDLSPTAELTYRKDLTEYGVAKLFYRYATSVIKMPTDLAPSPGYLTYTQGTNTESYAILAGGINDGNIQKTDSYAYDKNLLFTHLDLSQRKKYHAGATNGVHAIFAGGTSETGTGPDPNKLVNAFDNSLVRSIPEELSVARSYLKGCYLNGKAIFVCGTGTSTDSGAIDTYDRNLSHSSISSTTNANYLPKKGKGFGFTSNKNYAIIAGGGYTTTAYALTSSMVKSTISSLSKAKNYLNSTNVGKYCIFGGGFTKNSNNTEHDETDVEAYDENLVKTSCTSLSTSAGSGVCSQGLEYFGIIAGGRTGSGGKLKKVECYNSSLVKSILPDLSTTKRTDDASGAIVGEYFLIPNRYVSSSNPGTIEVYKEN